MFMVGVIPDSTWELKLYLAHTPLWQWQLGVAGDLGHNCFLNNNGTITFIASKSLVDRLGYLDKYLFK